MGRTIEELVEVIEAAAHAAAQLEGMTLKTFVLAQMVPLRDKVTELERRYAPDRVKVVADAIDELRARVERIEKFRDPWFEKELGDILTRLARIETRDARRAGLPPNTVDDEQLRLAEDRGRRLERDRIVLQLREKEGRLAAPDVAITYGIQRRTICIVADRIRSGAAKL